jgi:hypothetical protein
MMRGDLAYLTYIPSEDHPGFTSVGSSDARGDTTFFHNDYNEETEIANYAVVPFSDALNAAQEFAISKDNFEGDAEVHSMVRALSRIPEIPQART